MLDELHDRVGERVAALVRAEAAMVSCGAASALTLGTAAVLTGTDRQKIADLPNLAGMKSEVIIQKAHRFGYDRAVRNCGVRLIEVETAADLERAVNPQTAMMLFYNNNNKEGQIRDEEFVALGRKHGDSDPERRGRRRPAGRQPVEVHRHGLRSGGRSPAARASAARRAPASCSAASHSSRRRDQNGSPNGGAIGRGMKVNKEELVGMLAALELFVNKDHAREAREHERRAEEIRKAAAAVPGVKAESVRPGGGQPRAARPRDRGTPATTRTAATVVRALQDGEPSIVDPRGRRGARRRCLDDAAGGGEDRGSPPACRSSSGNA